MKKYQCQCPCGCNFETNIRQHIHIHHIKAKSSGGNNQKNNLIYLCPNCHLQHIYSGAKNHNIKNENTYELIRFLDSTAGTCLEYKDFFGNIDYRFLGYYK